MGFGLEARRVRDVSTPLDHRVHACKYCVEYESPLGYEGTFAYLEAATGHRREDPEFLDVALDLVERQRSALQKVETPDLRERARSVVPGGGFERYRRVTKSAEKRR